MINIHLVIQVGDAKDPVRKGVRALFGQLCCIYPPNKLFPHIVDGLKSKNSRQRSGTVCAIASCANHDYDQLYNRKFVEN